MARSLSADRGLIFAPLKPAPYVPMGELTVNRFAFVPALAAGALIQACAMQTSTPAVGTPSPGMTVSPTPAGRLARYTTVKLVADESKLTPTELQMLPLLIDAARQMDPIFWIESYGNRNDIRSISDST